MQTTIHPLHPLASVSAAVMDCIDALDPLICPRHELQALIDSVDEARDGSQVRAWLYGVMDSREMLSLITTGKEEF